MAEKKLALPEDAYSPDEVAAFDQAKESGPQAAGPSVAQAAAQKAGVQLNPSKESWLHDFITGAQGKNALPTNNWAEGAVVMGIPGVLPAAARAMSTAKTALGLGGGEAAEGAARGGSGVGAIARKLAKVAAWAYGGHEAGKLFGGHH